MILKPHRLISVTELEQKSRWNSSDSFIYDRWRDDRRAAFIDSLYLEHARFRRPQSVLEIGCGSGHLLEKLQQDLPST